MKPTFARTAAALPFTAAALALALGAGCDKHRPGQANPAPVAAATQQASPVVRVGTDQPGAAAVTDTAAGAPSVEPHRAVETMAMSGAEPEAGHCSGMEEGESCKGGCNQWDQAAHEVARRTVPPTSQWQTFAVKGMHCAGCERRIIANLGTLAGVISVEADAELGQVRVASAPGADLHKAVVDRINSLGYHAE